MKIENNTLIAEGSKVLFIKKLNVIVKQYTCGEVMLPIQGVLQTINITPDDVIVCYIVNIDGKEYKVQGDNYGELVSSLIRIKYTLDQELALLANSRIKDVSEQENAFQEWRAECKRIAKKLLYE